MTTTTTTAAGSQGVHATKRRRQRSPSPPTPRKKSCEACRKAKARCSEHLPKCSRCERKGIACDYGGTRNEDGTAASSLSDMDIARLIVERGLNNGEFQIPQSYLEALALTDALAVNGPSGFSTADSNHRSEAADSPDDGSGSSTASSNGSTQGYATSATSLGQSPIDPIALACRREKEQQWDPNLLPFIMRSYHRLDGSKVLEIIPNSQNGQFNPRFTGFNIYWPDDGNLSTNRVIGAFKIWPTRMVKAENLPPYIHPHFPTLQVSQENAVAFQSQYRPREGVPPKLPEPLANCSSICTMFYNRTPENSPFIWKNIKREQERIYEKYLGWEARRVLSSFQAMLIYAILRMIEGETEHNNFDMAFVLTVSEIGTTLWSDELRSLQTRKADPAQVNWSDWMFAESVCRTGFVFQFMFIMLGLYKALPPTPGCRGIDEIALPCGGKLWKTSSYAEWQQECKAYQASRKSNRVLTFGDLNALRSDSKVSLTPEEREDLSNWVADVDEFNHLVLVAGLAGPNSALGVYRKMHG